MAKYAQPILFFFCRPCGEYHLKVHPHYRAMKRRKLKRRELAEAKAAANSVASPKPVNASLSPNYGEYKAKRVNSRIIAQLSVSSPWPT
jgi:hypothetical protein